MNTSTFSGSSKVAAFLSTALICGLCQSPAQGLPGAAPSASERMAHGGFLGERFVWIGQGSPPEAESEALLLAVSSATTNRWPWSLSALEGFLDTYPQSGWVPSVRNQLARAYNQTGRYTLALEQWEAAWQATKGYTGGPGKKVADFTLAHWTRLLASLGRYETLVSIFTQNKGREFDTAVLTKWLRTREAVAVMGRNPGIAYQCGTYALFNAARALNLKEQAYPLLRTPSPVAGFSMKTLSDLSSQFGLGFVAVKRETGSEFVVPSVVHWKQNHYAAIVSREGEFYQVVDPTFGQSRLIAADTLNAEASGFFLVHSDQVPKGFRLISPEEASSIFGRGFYQTFTDGNDQPYCFADNGGNPSPPGNDGSGGTDQPMLASTGSSCGSCGGSGPVPGLPQWRVSEPYINLWIEDEPLGYQPAVGERTSFQIRYNQRQEAAVQDVAGVGPSWSCSWITAINVYDYFHYNTFNGYPFTTYYGQGGQATYNNLPAIATNYFNSLKLLAMTNSSGVLTNLQLLYPDGSIDYYGLTPTNSVGVQYYSYLTQKTSPEGYATLFQYDVSDPTHAKLTYVIDANGGTNYLYYVTNVSGTVLISQVTDPYGRTVTLTYDANDRLTNIVDVVGISSSILYDTTSGSSTYGWVTNLTTPYGVTSFAPYDSGSPPGAGIDRDITITQPDGGIQLYSFYLDPPASETVSYSSGQYPTNDPLNTLDTAPAIIFSYHWGPRQYGLLSTNNPVYFSASDFLRARMRHWLGRGSDSDPTTMDTLSIQREPSADGVTFGQLTWFDYTGKSGAYVNSDQGYHILPDYIGWVLPDGSSRSTFYQRNTWWQVTNEVTSCTLSGGGVGTRTNTYVYGANNQDLLRKYGPDGTLLQSYGYNANHQITAFTNAVGDWMTNAYNGNSQLSQTRSLTGLTTTNIYFTSGASINWLQQSVDLEILRTNSYSYYANGLVQTHTDERGLTTTNTWDNLQRMLTASDGRGTDSYTYNKLDLVQVVDPMGFTNSFGYDSMDRRITVTNALGRVTRYNYCNCGSLDSIQDAAGNYTRFYYDGAGRLTNTFYADGFGITNNFNLLNQITNTVDSSGSGMTNWFNNQGLLVAVSNAFGLVKSKTFDFYDHATNVVDANGVTVLVQFDNLGRAVSRTYPDTGLEGFGYVAAGLSVYTNQLHLTNFFAYDAGGRKTWETNANWEQTQFQYDAAGDLTNMVDGAGHSTAWKFDIYGRVTNKVDNLGNNLFFYGYDADNRLTNRNSAAKGTTTYRYDPVGNLTNVVYPVNTALVLSYDVLNRLTNMVDSMGTSRYTYDAVGQLLSEGGLWTDDTVSFTYNNRLRTGLKLLQPDASAWTESYGYDGARRLTSVGSPAGTFSYSYDSARHQLVNKLLLPNSAYITNTFDSVARLLSTSLETSGNSALNSHTYGNNVANQRTALTNFAGDYRLYGYEKIGQLKTVLGSESGGTARLLEQLGYAYDSADSLNFRTNNALVETFNVNTLNELSTITHSGTLTVSGTTTTNATSVTVNGSLANRYNDATFALGGFTVVNGNNSFTAGAQDVLGRTDTNSITVNLPATVTCVYDLNGNLTSDGTRGFDYDDENQLIRVTVTNSWKTEFTYDGKMRRRSRTECTWNGTTWLTNTVNRYVYDGNLVIEERDTNNLPAVKYTRGNDLSGTLQGAGGIGGLLARTDAGLLTVGSPSAHCYYHADGNGNITALINTNQAIVAKYLYDPFGNILSQSGSLADANLYRFSSKELHKNSGLLYYLYRYYEPNFQRWLNRDPIAEVACVNLYTYVENGPLDAFDAWGLQVEAPTKPPGGTPGSPPGGDGGPDDCEKLARAIINLTAKMANESPENPTDAMRLAQYIASYRAHCGKWPPDKPKEKPEPPKKPWWKRCLDWARKHVIISSTVGPTSASPREALLVSNLAMFAPTSRPACGTSRDICYWEQRSRDIVSTYPLPQSARSAGSSCSSLIHV